MKAALTTGYGGPEVIEIGEVDPPPCGPEDVRIAVHASSINPVDYKQRQGIQRLVVRWSLPWVQGLDVSGVVTEIGKDVTRYQEGDAVFASPTHTRWGAWAEEIVIPEAHVAPKPDTISHVEAATLPLVGLTAWQCLVDAAALSAGDKVLIQAGSGGVGTFAIQLATHLGAEVWTTCSAKNHDLVRKLGAYYPIDYRTEDFAEVCPPLDVVLDSLGGETRDRTFPIVRSGGVLTTIDGGMPRLVEKHGHVLGTILTGWELLRFKLQGLRHGVRTANVIRWPNGESLARIGALVDEGAIRPVVAEVFDLDDIQEAHRAIATGRTRGKIAIRVRE